MLSAASAMIRGYTGQDLEETTGRQEEYAASFQTVITLTQVPVNAVTSITVNAVAFTDYEWSRWGNVVKNDLWYWDSGPIVVTYDSGYAVTSDEYLDIQRICKDAAARALDPSTRSAAFETFGAEVGEGRGMAPALYLTEQERWTLDRFQMATVG